MGAFECQSCGATVRPGDPHTFQDCQSYLADKWYPVQALVSENATLRSRITTLESQLEQARTALERIAAEVFLAQRLDEDGADEDEQINEWSALAIRRQQLATAALQALREGGEGC